MNPPNASASTARSGSSRARARKGTVTHVTVEPLTARKASTVSRDTVRTGLDGSTAPHGAVEKRLGLDGSTGAFAPVDQPRIGLDGMTGMDGHR